MNSQTQSGAKNSAQLLLVDDDPDFRDALGKQLVHAGYRVGQAADGELAIEWLKQQTPDLVILDIVMPNKEGLETILALRRSHPRLPVIAISGGGRIDAHDYLHLAENLGAVAVLAKPFPFAELQAQITKALPR
ncbi:MAG TPA: response regulator [Candidatus Limnocylindria bacterium]|jgi:DNA-binding response OmpR family regulator|nr:response regulator [Candidatus Limnocylindria bacterium]